MPAERACPSSLPMVLPSVSVMVCDDALQGTCSPQSCLPPRKRARQCRRVQGSEEVQRGRCDKVRRGAEEGVSPFSSATRSAKGEIKVLGPSSRLNSLRGGGRHTGSLQVRSRGALSSGLPAMNVNDLTLDLVHILELIDNVENHGKIISLVRPALCRPRPCRG